jgi:hypothetical protein
MPREREHESQADRQRAYRERKRNAEGQGSVTVGPGSVTEPAGPGNVTDEDGIEIVGRRPSISEEDYVAQIVAEAEEFSKAIGETDAPFTVGEGVVVSRRRSDRFERASRYARWRYRGFLAGEVSSL